MEDRDCVRFLQWVLPQLRMRWPGFRKVRKQVCKRIQRRLSELGVADVNAYRDFLQSHREEWRILDQCCRVTVSRFYRDKSVLEHVRKDILPSLSESAIDAGEEILRAWSAGCAMGEEAYSLVLIWDKAVVHDFPQLDFEVVGSDIDELLLQRARRGCYTCSSVKALPEAWLKSAFGREDSDYCLEPRLRNKAKFIRQDIRDKSIMGPFYLLFCRNLAFTYFDPVLQQDVLEYLHGCLVEGGALVIGGHESLPEGYAGFEPWSGSRAVFRKTAVARDE